MNDRLQIAAMCLQGILGDSDAIATARKTAGQMQEKGIKTTQFEVLAMVATEYADALIEQEEATRKPVEPPRYKGASEEDRESLDTGIANAFNKMCHRCIGQKRLYSLVDDDYYDCPTCNGTGVER